MPKRSEYQALPQTADETDAVDSHSPATHPVSSSVPSNPISHARTVSLSDDQAPDVLSRSVVTFAPQLSPSTSARGRTGGAGIDVGKLDQAFRRWKDNIAQKVKRKRKNTQLEQGMVKEIAFSVFTPVGDLAGLGVGPEVKTLDHNPEMTTDDFKAITSSIQDAIMNDIHPKMIAKGSSGSYFARAKEGNQVKIIGVFKPKDEEPYGRLNPKTTKWIHRNLFWWVGFGRGCLIPNLSYISEASASFLDARLKLNIVPKTDLVSFSSPAFYYDWIDRMEAKKGKPLPEKIGSLQCFMNGYQDASIFLREHPWPGRAISDTFDDLTAAAQVPIAQVGLGSASRVCSTTQGCANQVTSRLRLGVCQFFFFFFTTTRTYITITTSHKHSANQHRKQRLIQISRLHPRRLADIAVYRV